MAPGMECFCVDDSLPETALHLAPVDTSALSAAFAATGYVELTDAFPPALRCRVAEHAARALETGGRRRDLSIGATGGSPRRYRLAGRSAIEEAGDFIPALYRSSELASLITEIAGTAAHCVPYAPEEYIATRFEEPGDTHGWHWDDYAFALIWVTAAPAPHDGGSLEFIPGIPWDKASPRVEEHATTRTVFTRHPATDTVYLLRADTMMHRVTPLRRATRREILCLSYATHADLERAISHETLEQLYASA